MSPGWGSVAFLGAVLLVYWTARIINSPKPLRNGNPLPSPPGTIPLLGNSLTLLRPRLQVFSAFAAWERIHGRETLNLHVPTLPPAVLVHSPQVLDFIFRHEGSIFTKGDFVTQRSWDLFGRGIINVEGPLWRAQRRAGLTFLNSANIHRMTEITLPRYVGDAARSISRAAHANVAIDLQRIFLDITTQLMGHMAYGIHMRTDDEFTTAFDYASSVTAERFQNPIWLLREVLLRGKMTRALSVVKSFGALIVGQATTSAAGGSSGGATQEESESEDGVRANTEEASGTLVHALLSTIEDRSVVIDSALNYLSAGRDTTAQALTWASCLLCKHENVANSLRQEALAVFRENGGARGSADGSYNGALVGICPSVFTPARMPYAMAAFYEALRLYPPVPFEIKQAKSATTLPDGTFLPSGSLVTWCIWSMGRSTATWGDNANDFDPSRWLHGGKFCGRSQAEFPVFNGGPRLCLGKHMAEAIAVQVLAVMSLMYNFIPVTEDMGISGSSLTLPKEGGFFCYPRERVRDWL